MACKENVSNVTMHRVKSDWPKGDRDDLVAHTRFCDLKRFENFKYFVITTLDFRNFNITTNLYSVQNFLLIVVSPKWTSAKQSQEGSCIQDSDLRFSRH